MKLFAKVINSLKAVTHKADKESASIFKLKKQKNKKQTNRHKIKSYHTEKIIVQNLM